MADLLYINKMTASEYSTATKGAYSSVTLESDTDILHYDGYNIEKPEGVVPDVSDALWVDSNGGKHFYASDTVNHTALTAKGQTFVGVVAMRKRNRVWVLADTEFNTRFMGPCLHRISGWAVGTAIQFKAYVSGFGSTKNLVNTFTPTKTSVAEFTAELSTFLKNNQPNSSGVLADGATGANYSWHAEVMKDPSGNDACYVVSDSYTDYRLVNSIVVSGATCDYGACDMLPLASTIQRVDGSNTLRGVWNKNRIMTYLAASTDRASIDSPTDVVPSTVGIISEKDWNNNVYPNVKAYYGTWDKYIDSVMIRWPASIGIAKTYYGKGKEYTYAMASRSCKKLDGTTEWNSSSSGGVYSAAYKVSQLGYNSSGISVGDWYMPSFDEIYGIFSPMDNTTDTGHPMDRVNSAFVQSNGTARPLSVTRWVPARYSSSYVWLLNSYGCMSNTTYFYNTNRACAVALLEF